MVVNKQYFKVYSADSKQFRLGDWIVDLRTGCISNNSLERRLEPILLAFLAVLIEFQGSVVSREQLLQRVWLNRVVSDDAIRAAVKKCRDLLDDNAKSPKYIRTLPLQGYMLIAECYEINKNSSQSALELKITSSKLVLTASIVSILIVMIVAFWSTEEIAVDSAEKSLNQIEYLTNMPGSELLADLNKTENTLLFSHRFTNEEPLQLYFKDLSNNRIQRLTWDDANYYQALWAPKGNRFVVTRFDSGDTRHLFVHFDHNKRLVLEDVDVSAIAEKTILGWSFDAQYIYVKDRLMPGKPMGISQFQLASGNLFRLTSPNVEGVGDFFAKESKDGKYLGVIRAIDKDRNELIVLDLAMGSIILNRVLTFKANRFEWSENSTSIVMSGFMGDLYRYRLDTDTFHPIQGLKANTNDVISLCGENCFIMREHNGNFLEIQEQPNPFLATTMIEAEHFNLNGAEDFPTYSANGENLYFASLEDNQLRLVKHDSQGKLHYLYDFDAGSTLFSLSVNFQETYILGQLDKRIFVIELATNQFKFITTELESVSNPSWSNDGLSVFIVKQEKEQSIVYQYELESNKNNAFLPDHLAYRLSRQGTQFAVNQRRELVKIATDQKVSVIAQLEDPDIDTWRVVEPYAYFMRRKGNSEVEMVRVDIRNGEKKSKLIARHRFRLNFDVHPSRQKILVVRSLLADSNIVKVFEQQ